MNNEKMVEELKRQALAVRKHAYVPYSHFAVGAAVEATSGRVFTGCNVENASFGLTICAERAAIFQAVAAGETEFRRIAVVADSPDPVAPCGACRQVMVEFGITEVMMYNMAGTCKKVEIAELLPYAFGPGQMKGAAEIE